MPEKFAAEKFICREKFAAILWPEKFATIILLLKFHSPSLSCQMINYFYMKFKVNSFLK